MMALDAEALEGVAAEAPACPVHPYGYHLRGRVNPAGSRRVFRDGSRAGVPARCAHLELELDESGRERDFIDELWLRERAPRTRRLTVLAVLVAAAVVLWCSLAGAAVPALLAVLAGGGAAVMLADRVDAAVQAERLRRVRDWHKRVGTPR